jgi:hypothetical protein
MMTLAESVRILRAARSLSVQYPIAEGGTVGISG